MNGRLFRTWANSDKLRCLDYLDRAVEAIHGPRNAVLELDREISSVTVPAVTLGAMLYPGTAASRLNVAFRRRGFDRDLASTRCLRVINAARRYGLKSPSLEDLRLPKSATIDPFVGVPLRLKVQPEGLLVYSVGDDMTDNGGAINKAGPGSDVGFGPKPPLVSVADSTKK